MCDIAGCLARWGRNRCVVLRRWRYSGDEFPYRAGSCRVRGGKKGLSALDSSAVGQGKADGVGQGVGVLSKKRIFSERPEKSGPCFIL